MLNIKKYKNIGSMIGVFNNNKALVYSFNDNNFIKDFENDGYDKLVNYLEAEYLVVSCH